MKQKGDNPFGEREPKFINTDMIDVVGFDKGRIPLESHTGLTQSGTTPNERGSTGSTTYTE